MWRAAWTVAQEVARDFGRDDVMTKAAALALYSALGVAPLVLLVLAATSWLGRDTEAAIVSEVESMVGAQAAKAVTEVIKNTKQEQQRNASGAVSAIVGLITVLFNEEAMASTEDSSRPQKQLA